MYTYAVVNQKGGIGKTTTAQALAIGLSKRGYKTLLIDLDAQGNLSYSMRAENSNPTAFEILTGTAEPKAAIIHTEQVDFIPCSDNMAAADLVITGKGKEQRLKDALATLKGYKYVIIDTPPALSIPTINALTAADAVIIPTQAGHYSLQGIGKVYQTISTVQNCNNPKLKVKGILITMFDSRTAISKAEAELIEQTAEMLNTKVFNTKIRQCSGIGEVQATQNNIYNYKPAAKVAKAVADYDAFIDELIEGRK